MKHYTSIEQSKKLLELGLSPESADMCWEWNDSHNIWHYVPNIIRPTTFDNIKKCIPCWSVGVLISLLPKRYCLETLDDGTYACYNFLSQYEKFGKTPTDAVYNMIVFLKEEKLT